MRDHSPRRLVQAFELFGKQVQFAVAIALALDLAHGFEHIVAVIAGAAVALAHEMQLLLEGEAAGILLVPAINHITNRRHPPWH